MTQQDIMAAVGVLELALTELHALPRYADPDTRERAARRVTSARLAVEEAARAALAPQSGLQEALVEAAWRIATGGQSKKLGRTLRDYAETMGMRFSGEGGARHRDAARLS